MPSPATPLVSILTPAFNAAPWLAECIESALGQSHPAIEVIVVDDGSTDDTLAIARSFEPLGVRVITQANAGQPAAMNAALAAAKGDFIQFLDADDVLHPNKVAAQLARLEKEPPLTVASGAWGRFTDDVRETRPLPDVLWQDLTPVDWIVSAWGDNKMMPVMTWLFPRAAVEAAGPWKESLRWASTGLDGHFTARALLASRGCVFCGEAMSYYRSVAGSQSRGVYRAALEASLQIVLEIGEQLLQTEDSQRTRAAVAAQLQRFVYVAYPQALDLIAVADARIADLGGCEVAFDAGPATEFMARLIGWRAAKRLRLAFSR